MRQVAIRASVLVVFAIALVGWWCEVPGDVCALRALIGGAAMFVLVSVAGRVLVLVVAESIQRGSGKASEKDKS